MNTSRIASVVIFFDFLGSLSSFGSTDTSKSSLGMRLAAVNYSLKKLRPCLKSIQSQGVYNKQTAFAKLSHHIEHFNCVFGRFQGGRKLSWLLQKTSWSFQEAPKSLSRVAKKPSKSSNNPREDCKNNLSDKFIKLSRIHLIKNNISDKYTEISRIHLIT